MIIGKSSVLLSSSSSFSQSLTIKERLRVERDGQLSEVSREHVSLSSSASSSISAQRNSFHTDEKAGNEQTNTDAKLLGDQGLRGLMQRQAAEMRAKPDLANKAVAENIVASQDIDESIESYDPKYTLMKQLLESMFGRIIEVFHMEVDPEKLASNSQLTGTQNSPATASGFDENFGFSYQYSEVYHEEESTHFSAVAEIVTSDGKTINVDLALNMSRSLTMSSHLDVRGGTLTDPLVLNFSGTSAQLTDQTFVFDLNSDGEGEEVHLATGQTAFLALDRNQDGVINNGSELFGTKTGDGFAELALLDDDKNGWLDSADESFDALKLFRVDDQGLMKIHSLVSLGIGALYLDSTSTEFGLYSAQMQMGQIRTSGIYLNENGSAGTMQQVDLVT